MHSQSLNKGGLFRNVQKFASISRLNQHSLSFPLFPEHLRARHGGEELPEPRRAQVPQQRRGEGQHGVRGPGKGLEEEGEIVAQQMNKVACYT